MPYSNHGEESEVVHLPGSHSDVEEFQLLLQTNSTDVISTLTAGWPEIPDRVECVCCRREDCADLSPTDLFIVSLHKDPGSIPWPSWIVRMHDLGRDKKQGGRGRQGRESERERKK